MARVALLLVSLAACLVLGNAQLSASTGQDMEQQMNQMYQQLSSSVSQASGQAQPSSAASSLQRARSMIQPYMDRLFSGSGQSGANMANLRSQMERLRSSDLGRQLSPQIERLRSSDLGRQLSQRLSQFSPSSSLSGISSSSNSLPSMSQ